MKILCVSCKFLSFSPMFSNLLNVYILTKKLAHPVYFYNITETFLYEYLAGNIIFI